MTEFSFEDLKRVWLAEKSSRNLAELREEFYQDVAKYMAELNLELKRGEPIRRELLQEELRDASRMVREIQMFRALKAMDEAIRGRLSPSLLERERYAFSEVKQSLEKLHAELTSPAMKGKAAVVVPRETTNVLLIIQAEIPQIVDDNLRSFGPFKRGDVASLPRRSGELMVKHGLARKIEVKS